MSVEMELTSNTLKSQLSMGAFNPTSLFIHYQYIERIQYVCRGLWPFLLIPSSTLRMRRLIASRHLYYKQEDDIQ